MSLRARCRRPIIQSIVHINETQLQPTQQSRTRDPRLKSGIMCPTWLLFQRFAELPARPSPRHGMVVILIALMVSAPAFVCYAQSNKTLPCVPAPANDSAPWVHKARVLESFPPDNPVPRFLGSFSDAASTYRLHLWRDAKGVFGELLSPVLDADSPTSRLYEPRFDAASGNVAFVVHFPPEQWAFSGVLRSNTLSGRFQRGTQNEGVILRKLPPDGLGQALRESIAARIHNESRAVRLLYDPGSPVLKAVRVNPRSR